MFDKPIPTLHVFLTGMFAELLSQPDELSPALSSFFSSRNLPSYAWMHFIRTADYEAAAISLSSAASGESGTAGRLVALNLAKMAAATSRLKHGAGIEDTLTGEEMGRLAMESKLVEDCEGVAFDLKNWLEKTVPAHQMPDRFEDRLDLLVETSFSKDASNGSLEELYRRLVGELMRGNVLTVEDLLDVLTLRSGGEVENNCRTALKMIGDMQALVPEAGRKQDALVSIWRRGLLKNEWVGPIMQHCAGLTIPFP